MSDRTSGAAQQRGSAEKGGGSPEAREKFAAVPVSKICAISSHQSVPIHKIRRKTVSFHESSIACHSKKRFRATRSCQKRLPTLTFFQFYLS